MRDYGNRMGIPTVNGALLSTPAISATRWSSAGLSASCRAARRKEVVPGDLIVALGGRTGRDGIHGATFSSVEMTRESEDVSGGAVQIGNAITEKKVLDVILQARDLELYRAITDCGAGGFSSAVGEMGPSSARKSISRKPRSNTRDCRIPKSGYPRPRSAWCWPFRPRNGPPFRALPPRERRGDRAGPNSSTPEARASVSTARWSPSSRWNSSTRAGRRGARGDLDGRPKSPLKKPENGRLYGRLARLLVPWDVCSKEWIVRQYDHEVQGRTAVRPLVGENDDGPGDAAVIVPVRGSIRGLAVACGSTLARQARPLRHGRLRDRRGDSQLRGRGRRSRANRASGQLLLGQHRTARNAGLAGAGRTSMPRRRAWRTARRSFPERTASTTSTRKKARAWRFRRRS